MTKFKSQRGFAIIELVIIIVVIGLVGTVGYKLYKKHQKTGSLPAIQSTGANTAAAALSAGKELSGGHCTGQGAGKLTTAPMRPEDFSILIPYGLMVGGHVTPIDHQYWAPKDYNSPRDAYPVYAMGDATLTEIQPRVKPEGTEYRMVFSQTCTFLYYYDLVTSLSGDVKAAYDRTKNSQGFATPNLAVTAGEQIGRIGHQTLDFAVWDTTKPLKGFIVPAHYIGESWKIYTANPFDYMSADLKALAITRDPRTVEPIQGKIDYDVDGKLIGNWFVQGSGGYGGNGNHEGYWQTHLSFSPDLYDPTAFVVSIGSWAPASGAATNQFAARGNTPNPADVSQASGLVKYELLKFAHTAADGSPWGESTVIKGPRLAPQAGGLGGCALVQMTGARLLKFEAFHNVTCASVSGFDSAAKIYER